MQVTLSERRMSELVRDLEGLQDQTLEEITHRMDMYARRFFAHVANYGVQFRSLLNQNGELATFGFDVAPSFSEEDRANRIAGIELMRPVSVTLSFGDLNAFVLNSAALAGIRQIWPEVSQQFNRILPSEILNLVENAAATAINSPAVVPQTEEDFERYCVEWGMRIPGLRHRAVEELRAAEEAEVKAAEEARKQRQWEYAESDDSSWGVREL